MSLLGRGASQHAVPPGSADAPGAGLAALSLRSPGEGAASGGGTSAAGTATPFALPSAAVGAASSSDTCPSTAPVGDVSPGGGAPAAGRSRLPAPRVDGGSASATPVADPPELLDDDGVPLSAEAAASPFSPPATERHAAFLKLLDHGIKAGLQKRHMRLADFSALAAEAGGPLFGDDSIIVASLRQGQARGLVNQSIEESTRGGAAGALEAETLLRRAWVVLLAQALPVLQRRMDEGTLLPGKLRAVETACFVYAQQTTKRVMEEPCPEASALQGPASACGYETAVNSAATALNLLTQPIWRADQRERAQAFVLAVLGLIPQTGGLRGFCVAREAFLVDFIERFMNPTNYGVDFCASVLAHWRSPAVTDVLRARGSLQGGVASVLASQAAFSARQKADVAKRGLRACGLPSCGRRETTVLQFHVCCHCQTIRYCCPEHATQHWKAHKRETEEKEVE